MHKKLVILSGPSCAGKSPLYKSFINRYPSIAKKLSPVLVYNNRPLRPGEKDGVDYYLQSTKYIKELSKKKNIIAMKVRGDMQAIDVEELFCLLKKNNMIFEGNPFMGSLLMEHHILRDIKKTTVFLSPLSKEEIILLKKKRKLKKFLTLLMGNKLMRRTINQKGRLSSNDIKNIGVRARSAYKELKEAYKYDYVIPNHDGEDSDNWTTLVGDARKSLLCFAGIVKSNKNGCAEIWSKKLIGDQ